MGIYGQGMLVQGRELTTLQGAQFPQPLRVLLSNNPSFVPPIPPAPIVTGQPFKIWRWGLVSLLDFLLSRDHLDFSCHPKRTCFQVPINHLLNHSFKQYIGFHHVLGPVLGPGAQWCTLLVIRCLVGPTFSREKQIKGILKYKYK